MEKVCTLYGCDNKHLCHGVCSKHYQRLRKTGHLTPPRKTLFSDIVASRTARRGGCLVWVGYINDNGYGIYETSARGERVLWRVHRLNWLLSGRRLSRSQVLDHTYHNRACIEVTHLRAVTQKQNCQNRRGANSNSSSGVRGVSKAFGRDYWVVQVGLDSQPLFTRRFACFGQACREAVRARQEIFTHSEDNQ